MSECTIFICKAEATSRVVIRPNNVSADKARKFEIEAAYCDEHYESQTKNLPSTLEMSLSA